MREMGKGKGVYMKVLMMRKIKMGNKGGLKVGGHWRMLGKLESIKTLFRKKIRES